MCDEFFSDTGTYQSIIHKKNIIKRSDWVEWRKGQIWPCCAKAEYLKEIRYVIRRRSSTVQMTPRWHSGEVSASEPEGSRFEPDSTEDPPLTLAPLDNDLTVAVAPEENEVPPSTSQIDASIQSILPLPRPEQRGVKRKRKSQKSEIMTSSPFKNLLEKNEKEEVELEEAKANRVFKKNKNGNKTKKGKALKGKKKLILNFIENPVPSTSSANNEGTICPRYEHTYNEDWIQCG
ncbi:hypothetical protein AVEN_9450-1 [Araneus ventricosus]|uniref:Uncharacterized protein n=1 Tax=Araneus ventricosus TaxID=182803 RepID=A0A4Y2FSE4_ARAVE|nr:hypothetical protein AVEN_9450-1 [Araneus ventricosus]